MKNEFQQFGQILSLPLVSTIVDLFIFLISDDCKVCMHLIVDQLTKWPSVSPGEEETVHFLVSYNRGGHSNFLVICCPQFVQNIKSGFDRWPIFTYNTFNMYFFIGNMEIDFKSCKQKEMVQFCLIPVVREEVKSWVGLGKIGWANI